MQTAWQIFLHSDIAKRFADGDCNVIAGQSDIDLAHTALLQADLITEADLEKLTHLAITADTSDFTYERSPEYWTAWSLAYYQWLTSLIFAKIDSVIPITQIYALYHPYHEMDILQFVDRLNELFRRTQPETELEVERQQAKLPQDKLAKLANISVKTIQQYEQCQKDINQAPVYTLYKLAKVLHCSLEDLIEKVPVVQPGGGK